MSGLQDITVRTSGGPLVMTGLPTPTPGLSVVTDTTSDSETWMVIHTPSGVGVGLGFPSPEAALGAATEHGHLLDWSQPGKAILARLKSSQALAAGVARITSRFGGHCYGVAIPEAEFPG